MGTFTSSPEQTLSGQEPPSVCTWWSCTQTDGSRVFFTFDCLWLLPATRHKIVWKARIQPVGTRTRSFTVDSLTCRSISAASTCFTHPILTLDVTSWSPASHVPCLPCGGYSQVKDTYVHRTALQIRRHSTKYMEPHRGEGVTHNSPASVGAAE